MLFGTTWPLFVDVRTSVTLVELPPLPRVTPALTPTRLWQTCGARKHTKPVKLLLDWTRLSIQEGSAARMASKNSDLGGFCLRFWCSVLSRRQDDGAERFASAAEAAPPPPHPCQRCSGSGRASGLPPPAPFLTFCHTLGDISQPIRNPITPQHL